ncbi:zinc-binding dehydrogenase [Chloroflexota bacterium]
MKAAILKDKKRFSIEEVPMPEPKSDEVVIKISYCAVCGSDINRFVTGRGIGLILGHEFSGKITQVGKDVSGWSVGDHVFVNPITYCAKCYFCLHQRENLCTNRGGTGIGGKPGAYAEYVKAKSSQLFRCPDNIGKKEATMAQCLAVAVHTVRVSGMKPGDKVVVIGAGPIGLLVLACSKLDGAGRVYAIEMAEGRKRAAEQMGADQVLDPTGVNAPQQVLELTGIGADVVFCCAGSSQAVRDAVAMVIPGGTVIIVAGDWTAEFNSTHVVDRELVIKGSKAYSDEFAQAVDLITGNKIDCTKLITSVEPLSRIQQVFEELITPVSQVKVLIAP